MKFICNQQLLSKAINTVSKAITSRTTIPILKGILIEAKDDKITLSASDLDLSIKRTLKADVLEEGSVVVLSKLFGDIVRKLPNDDITILENDGNTINIKCSASEFTLVGLSSEEFPNIGEIDEDNKIVLSREMFKEMIKKTVFSASVDESKGIIVGVLIEIEENSINMIALDGFRMAIAREEIRNSENQNIIIPAKILSEINKIVSETDEEDVCLIIDNKKAVVLLEETKVILRLLDGQFIKYKDILPKESKTTVIINKHGLLASIERASLLAKEGKNNLVKLSISDNQMLITSRSEEGNVKEEVLIEKNGENIEIGFNSKYLLDVLKALDEEEVKMFFNTAITPCLIKPVEGNKFEYLVLPVRINN